MTSEATQEGLGLADRILPARGAAQKASAIFAGQLNDSPPNPFREPASRTRSVKYRYTATGKHLSSPLKGSASSPERNPKLSSSHAHKGKAKATPVASSSGTSRKRKASSIRTEEISPIFSSSPSPLSSVPTPSPIASIRELATTPEPRRPALVSKSLSFHTFGPSTANVPLSSKRKQKKAKKNVHRGTDTWVIGNSVWLLVNQSGAIADSTAPDSSLMWWPAQVVQNHPLRVSLFGDFPSSSLTNRGFCTIFSPSPANIQSVNDDAGVQRFSRTTFRLSSTSADDDDAPPAKKPRLDDIETRWAAAVQSMEKASTLEKEGLPALLSSYATPGSKFYDSLDDSDPDMSDLRQPLGKPPNTVSKTTASTRKLKPQRSRASLGHAPQESTPPPRHWSPCPPDLTLQIPGELVLALAPKTGGFYWPAQILAHVPGRKEKYKVKFLDDEEHVVTRDKFWTSEEEGFVQCTLGEWESAIKTIEDPESGDEGADEDTDAQDLDESALPPPPPAGDFEDLSVRAQLAYVKPVLRAILNKEYAPAKTKHEAFMRGGSARAALLKSAGVRGGMDARFIRAVQKAISQWVLGDSGTKPERLDIADIVTKTDDETEVEGATAKVVSPKVVPAETLPHESTEDNKMEGIIDAVVSEDNKDNTTNRDLPLTTLDKPVEDVHSSEMVVDADEQVPPPLPPLSNGVTLSPVVKQAALKSQLDLLAEVSQAVATEPSLLPSHPELPRLRVDILGIPPKETSPLPSPLTSIADDEPPPLSTSVLVLCEEFEMLSGIEKLDYCLNVLLPECIQQLLLWRSGERTSVALLPPEEEQRLHDVGTRKAAETDWVDDVMRLRAAQARLWGVDLNKKAEHKPEVVQGGTRSRPRRGTILKP